MQAVHVVGQEQRTCTSIAVPPVQCLCSRNQNTHATELIQQEILHDRCNVMHASMRQMHLWQLHGLHLVMHVNKHTLLLWTATEICRYTNLDVSDKDSKIKW